MKYYYARLWPQLVPIMCQGVRLEVMNVYKQLKNYPQDMPIIQLLNECTIKKLAEFGIDHNFVY